MEQSGEAPNQETVLPHVDKDVLDVMHVSHQLDPNDKDKILHALVEDDQPFALEIVHEGYVRSEGDPKAQYAFIEGALYAVEAVRRTKQLEQAEQTQGSTETQENITDKAAKKTRFNLLRQTLAIFTIHSLQKAARNQTG